MNVEGACGFPAEGQGLLHILVEDDMDARSSIEAAGMTVQVERDVVVLEPLADRPGAAGAALRRITDEGANVDLLYLTVDGRVVLGGEDVIALEQASGDLAKRFDERL